jgi:hypothetical protein
MTNVKIAIGLRRESSHHLPIVQAFAEIIFNNLVDKVVRLGTVVSGHIHVLSKLKKAGRLPELKPIIITADQPCTHADTGSNRSQRHHVDAAM